MTGRDKKSKFRFYLKLVAVPAAISAAALTAAVAALASAIAAAGTAAAKASFRPVFQRTGFLNYKGPAVVVGVIQCSCRCISLGIVFKFNETKTPASAGHFVGDDGRAGDCPVLAE